MNKKKTLKNIKWELIQTDRENICFFDRILESRGLNKEFLEKTFWHNPFLFRDMKKSVERVNQAIKNKERIMIFGDYDADGITASLILYRYLTSIGASVSVRLPHREKDGYGIRKYFYDEFKKLDVKLVITVDNGISCYDEIGHGNSLEIDTIITDHHNEPKKIPNAFSILNAKLKDEKYPYKEIVGAGVALKFVEAILINNKSLNKKKIMQELVVFAMIGTVADCAPLLDENRTIVSEGIKIIKKSKMSQGIKMIMEKAGIENKKFNSDNIGFGIAPRLNAAGRISDPIDAFLALNGKKQNVDLLEKLNNERKKISDNYFKSFDDEDKFINENIIILSEKEINLGIIGLVAGKLCEKYHKATIVMSEKKDYLIGSCRSPDGFKIIDILQKADKFLERYGGHSSAAGFTMHKKNKDKFIKEAKKICDEKILSKPLVKKLKVDAKIFPNEINIKNFNNLQKLSPFGMQNPKPIFLMENVLITSQKLIGKDKTHIMMTGEKNNIEIKFIAFGLGSICDDFIFKKWDFYLELISDNYRGKTSVKASIFDAREKE